MRGTHTLNDKYEEITLYPSKAQTFGFMFVGLVGIATGIFLIRENGLAAGVVCTLFFGLVFLFFVIQLLPGSTCLRIQPEGFTVCSLFKCHHEKWENITSIYGISVYGHTMIGYEYTDDHKKHLTDHKKGRWSKATSPALPGTYGLPQDVLIELMTRYRLNEEALPAAH